MGVNQVISISTLKGGTGKTSTSAAILQAAVKDNKKVLAIDLDPQASLSFWMKADLSKHNSYDLLQGIPVTQTIQTTDSGIDIICGHASLSALKTSSASGRRLEKALELIKSNYDLIIIDTAPTLSEGLYNALFASDGVLIPLEADTLSVQALYQVTDVIKHVQANKPALTVLGVLVTRFDNRSRLTRFMRDTIKEKADDLSIPYLGEVRKGIAISEAMALQESLYDYSPKSKPAEDYKRIYDLIK